MRIRKFRRKIRDAVQIPALFMRDRIDLIAARENLIRERDNLILERDVLIRRCDEQVRQSGAHCAGATVRPREACPPIILCTLPKSGSIFLLRNLEALLDAKYLRISAGYFPYDLIDQFALGEFLSGAYITQSHFPPTEINLRLLAATVRRIWVHFRDPRAATLSWARHVLKLRDHVGSQATMSPPLPSDYYDRPFNEQLSWQIDNHLPLLIEWMVAWISAQEREGGLAIDITTYEEFVAAPVAFIRRAVGAHGFALPSEVTLPIMKSPETHFRSGSPLEWQGVFSAQDRTRAAALIPASVRDRFGWASY